MSKTLIAKGLTLNWTNGTGSAVSSGDLVIVGGLAAIAETDIANGDTGALTIVEVHEIDKEVSGGVTFTQGDTVYFDETAGEAKTTSGGGAYPRVGICYADAADADAVVQVKLNEIGASSNAQDLVLSGSVTWTGGADTLAEAVTGVQATDNIVAVIETAPTEAAYLESVTASGADEITFVLSAANTSNDAVIYYQVWR